MSMGRVALASLCLCAAGAARPTAAPTTLPTSPPTTRPMTLPAGDSRVVWPLPPEPELRRQLNALAQRYAIRLPANYLQKTRDESKHKAAADEPAAADAIDPSYALFVPSDDPAGRPFGLFVWISAGGSGSASGDGSVGNHIRGAIGKVNLVPFETV